MLSASQAEQLMALAERAKSWRVTRKVPPDYREDILQDAVAEALASEPYDGPLGPLESWFRTLVAKRVAKYFDAPARREQYLSPRAEEDELGAVDDGMAELEASDFEAQVAAAAAEAFQASNKSSQEAVALLAQGLGMAEIAGRLGISEEAAKARVSRFADAFKAKFQREGSGNRVDVTAVLNIADIHNREAFRMTAVLNIADIHNREAFRMGAGTGSVFVTGEVFRTGTGGVFVTGPVGGGFAGNASTAGVLRFDLVPAKAEVPNAETIRAMRDAEAGKGTRYASAAEMFKKMGL